MSLLTWILSHKLLVILVAVTGAFAISTIVLAVDNKNLRSDLDEKNSEGSTTSTPVTETTPTTPTETTPSIPTTPAPDMAKYRLPTSAKPLVYDLSLFPNLVTGNFSGKIAIDLQVLEETNSIILHSNGLTITDVTFGAGEKAVSTLDPTYERLEIRKESGLRFEEGNETITILFEGDMKNRIVGLYTSNYVDSRGTRLIATSKFEPTYARQAFPCFDEPNLKAIYKVHLLKPKDSDYIALSNFPALEQTEDYNNGEGEIVSFQAPDIPMSTYLSCFIVSDFKHTATEFENQGSKIPFRVYATPDQLEKTEYAGKVGKAIMEYYVNYFGLAYPLPKLDMVAIPDFVSGAMEHWGLVTYRETALLYTDKTHSSANKQRVATVVAHELAHSWFGNLVTMNWWNDLWLNEGFASYIEYKGVNEAEPEWGMMDQFLIGDLHSVLDTDSKLSSHPIIQTVETPDQITEVFDAISYNKGASILRMLEATVGDDIFKKGVTSYLTKYKFSNAVTNNFWAEIQEAVDTSALLEKVDVKNMMDTWTIQMGYPVVTVSVGPGGYVLTQKRFLKDPDATYEDVIPYNYKYTIPITFQTNAGKSADIYYFYHNNDSITIPKPQDAEWIKFNNEQIGYYRVNYPVELWEQLIDNYTEFSVSDRTHLIEEAFSLAEAGQLSYSMPLDLTKKLKEELDYVPWSVAYSMLLSLQPYLSNSQQESAFKQYVQTLVRPAYENLTWEENDADESTEHLTRLARVTVLSLGCAVDLEDCLTEAKARFETWINNDTEVLSPNLRTIIYKYGMRSASAEIWEKMFTRFEKETDANEKLKLMSGLTNVQNPSLLTKLITLAEDETYVRSQDYFTLLQYIAANPIGTPIVWDYVRENWPALVDRFTLNSRTLGSLIPSITSTFTTQTKHDEMSAFFAKYPDAGAGVAARKRALENVSNNIKWIAKYRKSVEDWIVASV